LRNGAECTPASGGTFIRFKHRPTFRLIDVDAWLAIRRRRTLV
jgi:hypothetical protein